MPHCDVLVVAGTHGNELNALGCWSNGNVILRRQCRRTLLPSCDW